MTVVTAILLVALVLVGFVLGALSCGANPDKAEGLTMLAISALIILVSVAVGIQATIECRWYDKTVNGPVPVEADKK